MPAFTSTIHAEVARFDRAHRVLATEGRAVVLRGAVNLKKQLQSEAKGVRHAPALPSTITYDAKMTPVSMGFEVGPAKGHAGSLALLYFGNSKTGARLKDPRFALQREGSEITRRLVEMLVRYT